MVLRCCKNNKESVLEQVKSGKLDAIALSTTNLVDDIILSMHTREILDCLTQGIQDKRKHNKTVPYNVIWASAIASKMKVHTSLTDIPYAITDHRVLGELGYSLYDDSEYSVQKSLDTSNWIVSGYVDSQNGFGAMIRTRWTARFTMGSVSGGKYKISNYKVTFP